MLFVYGILVAVQIVLGQILWKMGVEKVGAGLSIEYFFSSKILSLLTSPYIIVGVISYVMATLIFMTLLAKYPYTELQSVVVSSSLIATFLAASLIFHERISLVNILGLVLLIAGVLLITKY